MKTIRGKNKGVRTKLVYIVHTLSSSVISSKFIINHSLSVDGERCGQKRQNLGADIVSDHTI